MKTRFIFCVINTALIFPIFGIIYCTEMDEKVLKILDHAKSLLDGNVTLQDLNCCDLLISYKLYDELVEGLTVKKLNLQKHLPALLQLIDSEIHLPNKISNLSRKVKKYIQKAGEDNECLQNTIEELYQVQSILHPDFLKLGIRFEDLTNENYELNPANFEVKNSHILNLRKIIRIKSLPWKHAARWIGQLMQCSDIDEHNIRKQWDRLYVTKEHIHRNSNELNDFLNETYKLPFSGKQTNSQTKVQRPPSIRSETQYKRLSSELLKLYTEFQSISAAMYDLVQENMTLKLKNEKLADLEEKYSKQKQKIYKIKKQLAEFKPVNVTRKIKRRDDKINKITTELKQETERKENVLKQKNDEIKTCTEIMDLLAKQLKLIKAEKLNEQKMKSYYKRKANDNAGPNTDILGEQRKENKVLKEQVKQLELENDELKEKLDDALNGHKELNFFKDGKYDDSIRIVYMDLLGMGVSIRNCQKIVETVLSNLLDITVNRLPQKTLSSILSVEAQILAQAQAAEEMLKNENNTLHFDGTKKNFKEYAGFQVSCNSGRSYSLGHELMATGTADSYIQSTKDIIDQLSAAICEEEERKNEISTKLILSIKNTMTDRHVVNKSYIEKLENIKNEMAPDVGNWEQMTEDEKKEMTHINGLYCGLHIIVNMATAAVKGLSNYEKEHNIINDYNQQPVASELVRQVAKAFMLTSGDMKSGDALDFKTYLDSINEKFHYITFKHNRFNVLFHDAGALYYHHQHIIDYLESGASEKKNKLITAIKNICQNEKVIAECQALGLIGKVLCGPLWRLLESKNTHFFEMNQHWIELRAFLILFSQHPEEILSNTTFDGAEIEKDIVYRALTENLSSDTSNAIKFICREMITLVDRQLKDQLPGGKFHLPSPELVQETQSVPLTNRISEADFSDLDRSIRNAPQKSHVCISGLICFKKNKTRAFINKLGNDKKQKYLQIARKQAKKRLIINKETVKRINNKRLELMRQRTQKKQLLLAKKIEKEESLKQKMIHSGVWTSELHLQTELEQIPENRQKQAIKDQISFHRFLLSSKIKNREYTSWSKNGKSHSVEKLKENLLAIINDNFETVPQHIQKINMNISKDNSKDKRKPYSETNDIRKKKKSVKVNNFEVGKFYAVAFSDTWYIGECLSVKDDSTASLKYLHPSGFRFQWPRRPDVMDSNIQCILDTVNIVPSHGGRLWECENRNYIDKLYKNH